MRHRTCDVLRAVACAGALLCLFGATADADEPVTLFAAASTTEAVTAAAAAFAAEGGGPVRTVFAGSSTLAQQILRGAPADLFLSANTAWMDHLAARGAVEAGSRVDLVGNRLVLVAPADSSLDIALGPGSGLAAALGERRLAMADPAHVPAGLYAKDALQRLGLWRKIEPKAAFAGNVRAALALVERGEVAAGIVYATDVRIVPRLRAVAEFPQESHGTIAYPLAIVAGRDRPPVAALHRFLTGPRGRAIFRAHGFVPLDTQG